MRAAGSAARNSSEPISTQAKSPNVADGTAHSGQAPRSWSNQLPRTELAGHSGTTTASRSGC